MKISDVLKSKQVTDVVTVDPDRTVRELLGVLAEHNIGAVVVRRDSGGSGGSGADGGEVAGIVSERDVVRRLHDDDGVLDATVSTIMTAVVHTCSPSDELDGLQSVMTEHRIRHVPVLDRGRLVGVVSIGDVVKSHIDQVEFERDQLTSYLHQT